MENNKLSQLSNEELLKKEKALRTTTPVFTAVIVILFIVTIFNITKKGFSATSILPIVFLPMLISAIVNWKEIKKEMKLRNISQ